MKKKSIKSSFFAKSLSGLGKMPSSPQFFVSVLSALRSSMFALQTRAAHLLLDCPPDTLRCALTASRFSPAHRSVKKMVRCGGYNNGKVLFGKMCIICRKLCNGYIRKKQ